jgi:UDP-glucose 4-epimerase
MLFGVTGATGFVGSELARYLEAHGDNVRRISRDALEVADLSGVDVVVHCAALAHQPRSANLSFKDYERVNHQLAVDLARRAVAHGVRRFIFLSTVNVVAGNAGFLKPSSPYSPISFYGLAKANAERELRTLEGIEVVILRPPLVYGEGAPGNLRSLARLCSKPIPLPLASVKNRRSLVSRTNLIGAIAHLARADAGSVAGKTFHVADPEPLSTPAIIKALCEGMGTNPKIFPFPVSLLKAAASLVGKGKLADQLLGDALVDSTDLLATGWIPVPSDDLRRTAVE